MDSTPVIAPSIPIDWARFKDQINLGSRFLLTSHVRPDGDSLGSELAMLRILRLLGKEARIVNAHPTPPSLSFMDTEKDIRVLSELDEEEKRYIETIDTFLILDTSSWAQLGDMGVILEHSAARKLVLDHHAIGNDLGAEKFVDATAEATGTLCFQAAKELGVDLNLETALPMFVAIVTDTGWFRFSSVRAETFQIAAELLRLGVRPDEIYRELYERESLARMRLIGSTLERIESHLGGKLACTWIELSDFERLGALASDSEDIVNMTLQIDGTLFAVIFVEQRSGGFKVSFRSRCELDCSRLAAFFQGGGHKRAAGATIFAPLEDAKKQVLNKIIKTFEQDEQNV